MNKKVINVILLALWICTIGLMCWYTHSKVDESHKLLEEVEYYDSLNRYNKVYYSKTFNALKKENKELYDSLKAYKDKIGFVVQFTHEKEYDTGKVENTTPVVKDSIVYDTVPVTIPQVAKTYEYSSEPNDTFQYKLNVNSFTEPNWYSLNVNIRNKYTIVNKEDGGVNHITINPGDGGSISDVTVFNRKEKASVLKRFSVGPSVTAGYDVLNKQWGIMVGASVTFDIK